MGWDSIQRRPLGWVEYPQETQQLLSTTDIRVETNSILFCDWPLFDNVIYESPSLTADIRVKKNSILFCDWSLFDNVICESPLLMFIFAIHRHFGRLYHLAR